MLDAVATVARAVGLGDSFEGVDVRRPAVTLNNRQRAVRKCSKSLTWSGAIGSPTLTRTRLVTGAGRGHRRWVR